MLDIIPIVEGTGEIDAVPLLLRRLLEEKFGRHDWRIRQPKNAHGCGNLTAPNGIERFVRYALIEQCHAILILIDRDAINSLPGSERPSGDCAADFARVLSRRISAINPSVPVVVVIACHEYESWIVASIETMGISGVDAYQGNVEDLRSPKGWIDARLPRGQRYKETIDQVRMTAKMNLDLVETRSRSFRRLQNALAQILQAHENNTPTVTPL